MNFPGFFPLKQGQEAENSYEPGGSDVVRELSREPAMFQIGLQGEVLSRCSWKIPPGSSGIVKMLFLLRFGHFRGPRAPGEDSPRVPECSLIFSSETATVFSSSSENQTHSNTILAETIAQQDSCNNL